ncbi:hypothetical protein [Thiorhodococcus minor]|uniref:Uncharacterized protein n=1 Tax=Thiorhodococcus minor TaxID=57489 RepID=A0A6M0JVA9_9GAMM|nr:hypothetical protein [Thiorhodococcus minor]NEV60994.1 hypothetical protein [Thiorhodococcus minor]
MIVSWTGWTSESEVHRIPRRRWSTALPLPIHQIGVEFSREQRQVVRFEVETLEVV